MAVKIVDDACVFAGQESTITVSGDSIDDVAGTEAKNMALQKAAALGVSKPGISDQSGYYPVDSEGNTLETLDGESVTVWRNDFRIVAGS